MTNKIEQLTKEEAIKFANESLTKTQVKVELVMKEFNINQNVKVRLKEMGFTELRRQHNELRAFLPMLDKYTPPFVDEEGYSTFQLHSLMNRLGHLCKLGVDLPFETNIILLDQE